jgi:uncharacterized protein (TIGR00251 family)
MTRADSDLLSVHVQPRARERGVVGWQGEALRVRVTAAPERGQATREAIRVLAECLKVAPSAIQLVRGAASRDKLFRVAGLSGRELRARVAAGAASAAPGSGSR